MWSLYMSIALTTLPRPDLEPAGSERPWVHHRSRSASRASAPSTPCTEYAEYTVAVMQHAGTSHPVERGWSCLKNREWPEARAAFQEAVDLDPSSGSAWEGLGAAAMFLDDGAGSRKAHERAYREYLERGDFRGAARVAIQLALYHDAYRGELAIASGWFERARSLLATVPPSPEHAWLAFWKAHLDIHVHGEVARGEPSLEEALRLSEQTGPGTELELMMRGLRGLMAISEGAIDEGLRRLDEATAAVTAEKLPTPQTIGWTYCYVLDACENVRDIDRASQWIDRAFEMERDLGIQHLMGACREHYIGILTWRGDYAGAERQIESMRREVEGIAPMFVARSDIRLGEIRRRQGRLEEAAALLEPQVAKPSAMLSLAWLALDRGSPRLAVDLIERYFRRVSDGDRIRRLQRLDVLTRATIALGDTRAARAALDAHGEVVRRSATPMMQAAACELQGLVRVAEGDLDEGRKLLEDAVDGYSLTRAPYEGLVARLALGDVLKALGRADSAEGVLHAALSGAREIGATRLAQRASDALAGERAERRPTALLTEREIEVLALVAQGISNQEIGERLFISAYTVKRHIANILNKLDLPTRAAAAAYAIREGLAR